MSKHIELIYRLRMTPNNGMMWAKTKSDGSEFARFVNKGPVPSAKVTQDHENLDIILAYEEGSDAAHTFLGRYNDGTTETVLTIKKLII